MGASWDTEVAAVSLGVHRTTIYRRMRRLGIPVPTSAETTLANVDLSPTPTISRFAGISADLHGMDANRANATA
jgi:hypothetical protein